MVRQRKSPNAKKPSLPSLRARAAIAAGKGLGFEELLELASGFPDLEASTSYGTPALKCRGELVARMHQDGTCIVLRCADLTQRDALLQMDPEVFFITDHYAAYPWVLARRTTVKKAQLRQLLREACAGSSNEKNGDRLLFRPEK